jgi:Fe-S-cluster containining protein
MEHRQGRPNALCLRAHAGYRCRHAGACCSAGWAIPVEPAVSSLLDVHFGPRLGRNRIFVSDEALGGRLPDGAAAVLGLQASGACVFFEGGHSNLCAIHRELGVESLPMACRQFPRVVLQDPRGTLISLSHFCPTAAALLRVAPPATAFEIVEAPPSLALAGQAEGLDARDVLPPLLRPGMLADHDGYDAWERRAIAVLARNDLTAARALEIIRMATLAVQTWRPGPISLRATVDREFDIASARKPDKDLDGDGHDATPDLEVVGRVRLAVSAVPPGLPRPPVVEGFVGLVDDWRMPGEFDGVVRAYLAARLFGNWVAYYGRGLHAIVEYLQVALAVVKMEAFRQHASAAPTSPWQTVNEAIRNADLLLVHLADAKSLSRRLG